MNTPSVKGGGDEAGISLDLKHLPVIEKYGGRRTKQAIAVAAAMQTLAPFAKWAYERRNQREDYTITVAGMDDIYPDLHEWVLSQMPENDRKALIATTEMVYSDKDLVSSSDVASSQRVPRVRLRYDGSRKQAVSIGGHKVVVAVEREDVPGRANLPENWRQIMEKITFTSASPEGRDAVVEMIDGLLIAKREKAKSPTLYVANRYGWSKRGDLPPRILDSVILKEGQLERLIDDLGTFLEEEEEYNRLAQPWHRGYLIYGSPGTGKTSAARALANHFNLPVYYLPLGDIEKDTDLMSLVGSIEPRSMLLLEDADIYHAATNREEEKGSTSLAAMLNALDGVYTPHGLITVMTTNNRDKLDSALIRAGRIDIDEEFTPLDLDQAQRLSQWFGNVDFDPIEFEGEAPSTMIGKLRNGY